MVLNIRADFPAVDSRPLLVVLEIALAVVGTSLLMGGVFIGMGWLAERRRGGGRRALTQDADAAVAADASPLVAADGTEIDPINAALQAVEMGAVPQAEPQLWALAGQSVPLAARARLGLAYILSARGEVADAEEAAREAIRAEHDLLDLCVELSGMHIRAGRDAAAEALLRGALRMVGETEQDREAAFLAHHLYGQVLRQQQRLTEAEEQLRLAVQLRPNDAFARNNYGAVLDALGRTRDARRQYEEGVRLAPENSALHANLGGLLMREGHLEEARNHLSRAAELAPERYTAHIQLASLHLKLAQWREATEQASAAVAVRPDVGVAHGSLAQALVQLGQYLEAESHARRAVELAPNQAEYQALLGYILVQTGRHDEGLHYLRSAFLLFPDLPAHQRAEADYLATRGLREAAQAERRYADFLEEARRQLA